jgi:tetratricopeptide (TPR) repeat protein
VAWNQSNGEVALKYFFQCLTIRPVWLDAVINAFDTALSLGRIDELMPMLEIAISQGSPHSDQFIAMRTHILANGPAIYSASGFDDLESEALILKKAEAAAEKNRTGDAILIYLDALKLRPGNPQALNGLGILAFQEKRYDDAFGLFQAATALHPLDQDILMNLWECAQSLRREKEVLPKLKLSLERNPALEDIRAIVKEYA